MDGWSERRLLLRPRAHHIRATVDAIRARLPAATIEALTPDFQGDPEAVRVASGGALDVFNHNVETVPRLYSRVRPRARYAWSLGVLRQVADERPRATVKSGLMVGLGETADEVCALLDDLRANGVDIVTIGQYLRPTLRHVPVAEYLLPDAYERYRAHGRGLGFAHVFAGPFVRSSYNAAEALRIAQEGR